jgi:putative restriction endonuclease
VRSTIASRYDDERVADDRTWYDYSPKPERNDWLRECMDDRLPLLYFLQVKPKPGVEYLVFAPVEVIDDDSARERFLLDLNPSELYEGREELDVEPVPERLHRVFERRCGVSEVRTRLFQAHFRREVLGAYGRRCSVCSLKESPLLDGAHLVPDREELGAPRVRNGLSLCALHHRAFDRDLLGITPELTVHVFRDRLEAPEEEPTRVVTRFHERELRLPDREDARPDPELVEVRWEAAREG